MPFDKEFEHHLHEVMVAASLQVQDEIEQRKRELIHKAQQTHNGAAMPIAYSDAAIYGFRTRTQRVIDSYFQALNDCGIVVDASVEREMLQKISVLTSAVHPLTFPPAIRGAQVSAVQGAHSREAMRVGNQLQREAANRLRAAKLKNGTGSVSASEAVAPLSNRPSEPSSSRERRPTFISYAWETPEHQQWVLGFAETLRHNGVDVVLDEWHLPPGADMYHFMEQSVRSAAFVLVICTPAYAAKANARLGGVGYESRIITAELAQQTQQRKFIPILRTGDFEAASPLWLASRRGLDFTGTPYAETTFQQLLRTLHGAEVKAPALGPKPEFRDPPTSRAASPASQTAAGKSTRELARGDELNNTERELLDAAVQDASGQISHRRPIGPDQLIANGRNFIEAGNPRSSAKWLQALQTLEGRG